MNILKNDNRLHIGSESVPAERFNTSELQEYCEQLSKTMKVNGGIGLAAPQVGDNVRIFVMNINGTEWTCINPKIQRTSFDKEFYKEGCLSFPGLRLNIQRPSVILATYFDYNGDEHTEEMEGLVARCFQHEYDHINGITFDEHVGEVKLKIAKSKIKKLNRRMR